MEKELKDFQKATVKHIVDIEATPSSAFRRSGTG